MRFRLRYRWILITVLSLYGCRNDEQGTRKEPSVENASVPPLPDFDSLWNFDNLVGTEVSFRRVLSRAKELGNKAYVAELLTQIARSQGFQQKYSDALATLDEADAIIEPEMKTARVRSLLERGRVLNSSGKAADSAPIFKQALDLGREAGLDFHAVD